MAGDCGRIRSQGRSRDLWPILGWKNSFATRDVSCEWMAERSYTTALWQMASAPRGEVVPATTLLRKALRQLQPAILG